MNFEPSLSLFPGFSRRKLDLLSRINQFQEWLQESIPGDTSAAQFGWQPRFIQSPKQCLRSRCYYALPRRMLTLLSSSPIPRNSSGPLPFVGSLNVDGLRFVSRLVMKKVFLCASAEAAARCDVLTNLLLQPFELELYPFHAN